MGGPISFLRTHLEPGEGQTGQWTGQRRTSSPVKTNHIISSHHTGHRAAVLSPHCPQKINPLADHFSITHHQSPCLTRGSSNTTVLVLLQRTRLYYKHPCRKNILTIWFTTLCAELSPSRWHICAQTNKQHPHQTTQHLILHRFIMFKSQHQVVHLFWTHLQDVWRINPPLDIQECLREWVKEDNNVLCRARMGIGALFYPRRWQTASSKRSYANSVTCCDVLTCCWI